jgi:hypothetical protein
MREPDLFSSGKALRDEALDRVSRHAGEKWMAAAVRACLDVCDDHAGQLASGEMVRHLVEPIVGPGYHPNVWGAVIRRVIKLGGLVPTGRIVAPRDTASHASKKSEYRLQRATRT